jgi:hypothetical protein
MDSTNPVWTRGEFHLPLVDISSDLVTFTIYDSDDIGKDDPINDITIPTSGLVKGPVTARDGTDSRSQERQTEAQDTHHPPTGGKRSPALQGLLIGRRKSLLHLFNQTDRFRLNPV